MTDSANVYAPPVEAGGPIEDRHAFSDHSTAELKKLYNHSHTVGTLGVLWCLGVAVGIWLGVMALGGDGGTTLGLIILAATGLQLAAVIGAFGRAAWGRTVGMIACGLMLLNIPLGTVIGIFGLIAYGGGGRLFGEGRYRHAELKAEYKRRKRLGIA